MKYYDYYKEKINDINSIKEAVDLLSKYEFYKFVNYIRSNWCKLNLIKADKNNGFTSWLKAFGGLDRDNDEKRYDYKTYKSKYLEILLNNINSDVELNLIMVCIIIYESSFYTKETILSAAIKDNSFNVDYEKWDSLDW